MGFEGTDSPRTAGRQVGRQVCELLADGLTQCLAAHTTPGQTLAQSPTMSSIKIPCVCVCVCVCACAQLCLTCRTGYSPPGSMGFSRQEYWSAISSSRGFFQPRDQTCISCLGRWVLYHLSHRGRPIHTHTHTHTYISHVNLYTLYKSSKIPEWAIWA